VPPAMRLNLAQRFWVRPQAILRKERWLRSAAVKTAAYKIILAELHGSDGRCGDRPLANHPESELGRRKCFLLAIRAQLVNQYPRRIWNRNLAIQDVGSIHVIPVQCLIPAFVSLNYGAVKANTCKIPLLRE
jgi:hypothetical protein